MEEQEYSTEAHKVMTPGPTQDPEGQIEGEDALQVGRPVHSNRDEKRSGFQVAHVEWRRRALHMERGHAPEVLCLNHAEVAAFCSFIFLALFLFLFEVCNK
jgi:hypothetical protein